MKSKSLLLVISLFISLFAFAQYDTSTPVLKDGDVKQFLKSFKPIQQDLEALDLEFDSSEDLESMMETYKGVDKVNDIVQKHGYKDYADFAIKAWAITASYASVKMDDEGTPAIKEAIAEIEADESMTPEQKAMAKQQLEMVMNTLSATMQANADDIKTVKPYISQLDELMDEE